MLHLEKGFRSNRYAALSLYETEPEEIITSDDALEPDPGTEADFQVEGSPFAFSPGHLTEMVDSMTLDQLDKMFDAMTPDQLTKMFNSMSLGDFYALEEKEFNSFATSDSTLEPDAGAEADFQVEDNPFAFSPSELGKMFNPKNLSAFYALGGLQGLEKGLRSDRHAGLSLDESKSDGFVSLEDATGSHSPQKHHKSDETLKKMSATEPQKSMAWQDCLRIYGNKRLPTNGSRSCLQLLWVTHNDKILLLLIIASVISLALGLYEMSSTEPFGNRKCDGITTACTAIATILSLVFASSLQEHRKKCRTHSKGRRREGDWLCRVIRSGSLREVQARELIVGDVLIIDAGDIIPVDGVLIDGHNIKCDESSTTGESDVIRKQSSDEVFDAMINNHSLRRMDPLLVSGSYVLEGAGHMMCTATGAHSSWGKVLASFEEPTSLPDSVSSTETSSTTDTRSDAVHAVVFMITVLVALILQLTHYTPLEALTELLNLPTLEEITSNTLLIKFCLANFATSVASIPWAILRRAELNRRLNIWEAWAALQVHIRNEDRPISTSQKVSQGSDPIFPRIASEKTFALKQMRSDRDTRATFLTERAAIDSLRSVESFNQALAHDNKPPANIDPTYSWLLSSSEYQSWERSVSLSKPLWIKGSPGSGKSALMKSMMGHVRDVSNQGQLLVHYYESPRFLKGLDLSRTAHFSTREKEDFIEGLANGSRIQAFPDTGADRCSISPELASKLGLELTPGSEETLELPNGSHIQSPGMVEISWKFAEEPEERKLKCWVVPGSVHDLILGSPFLRASQTLGKFAHRIKSKLVNPHARLRVRLLGDTQQRLGGSLDGHETLAMADSGSDVMLISKAYAQKCGLHIDRDPSNMINLEFVDGSTEWTNGIVRSVPWSVGGTIRYCDFYVLDSLCVDLILSNAYLTETNSFVNHADSFLDLSQPREVSQLCLIRLIGRFSSNLNLLELDYLRDLTSPDAFNDEKTQRELARRDQIRDEIAALPLSEQEAATRAETERQLAWENHREAHRQGWRAQLAGPLLYSSSSESGGSSGAPLAGQGFVAASHLEAGRSTSSKDGKQGKRTFGNLAGLKKLLRSKP